MFKPQKCTPGAPNAMEYADMFSGLGAKKAKLMTLPEQEYLNAWLAKAQMQFEASQQAHDSGAMNAVYDSENDLIVGDDEDLTPSQLVMDQNNRDYAQRANNFVPLDAKKTLTAIKLLHVLRHTKASLDTYEEMMRWHLVSQNLLHPRDSLAKSPHFVSRDHLYKYLKKRYNRHEGFGIEEQIVLPGSKARATMITNETAMVIQQLLIDPRVRPEDYLFNDKNDPFAPP